MRQWCHSLVGWNIGHSFGQMYYPCHKWLWAQWYSQGFQWAMANMSTKIGDLMSSQMSISCFERNCCCYQASQTTSWKKPKSRLNLGGYKPSLQDLLLEGFHIVFWISSCVNFASHEHYYWVRSSESPRMWDQVSLQELVSVSPSSNERVTSFNCGMNQNWTWFSDPVLVTPDLSEFCWSADLAKARM